MSDATRQAVEDALLAHMQDECDEPWLLTEWLAVVAARSTDLDRTNYVRVASDSPLHVPLGLVEALRYGLREAWTDEDDD